MSDAERRCPSCGALVSPEADWCGQCFTDLREQLRERKTDPLASGRPPAQVSVEGTTLEGSATRVATWPCPTCETQNPLELNLCKACGTPFAAIFKQDDALPRIDPKEAFVRSLGFPGLAHRSMGRGGEGLARAVVFLMCFVIAITAVVSGITTSAVGAVAGLFGGLGLLVYFGTAYEAYRMAGGAPPLLSSRAIVWIVVGVLLTAVLMLALLITVASRPPATS